MTVPIATWTLQGLINGERVHVTGSGSFNGDSGRMALDLKTDAPLPSGFDLIPAQMICNVASTGFAAAASKDGFSWRTFSPDGVCISPARIGRVHSRAGIELLQLSAVTTLEVRSDGLHVDNMVEGTSHLPPNLELVSGSETLLPHGDGRGVGLAQFTLAGGGEVATGITTSPYSFREGLSLPTVVARSIDFTGSRRHSDGAHIEARSVWTTLSEVALQP